MRYPVRKTSHNDQHGGHFEARACGFALFATLCVVTMADAAEVSSSGAAVGQKGQREAPAGDQAQLDALDEVIVTAQKRLQNAQDVGVSITALGKEALQMLGHRDVTALSQQVSGLQVQQYSPSITVFNIRGVSQNDFQDIQEAPVAFYNDEAYVSSLGAISGQTFDLERIEVLRGPQGTLFGRNATGGLVQIVTAKPTKELSGYATVTGGSYGQTAADAAISGPLSDTVRGRLAVTSNYHDGYVRNLTGKDVNNSRFYGARAQLEWDVSDRGKLSVKFEGLRNDHEVSGGSTHVSTGINEDGLGFALGPNDDFWSQRLGTPSCPGCDMFGYRAGNDPFVGSFDSRGIFDRTFWNTAIRYEHDLGFAQLTSLTDYQHLSKHYAEDSDVSPLPVFNIDALQHLRQLSEELRLAGDAERLHWVAGVYGLKIDTDLAGMGNLPAFGGLNVTFRAAPQTKSIAGFAQGEYSLNDLFSVIAGARYSSDRKSYDFTHIINGFTDFTFNPGNFPDLARRTDNNYSGKLELDAKPNANTLVYVSVNRGTKSGGFGVPAFGPDENKIPFAQEVLINYEGGYKLTLAQNRITFNGSIFHYDYRDYQAFTTDGFSQVITNRPAQVNGVELDLTARPITPVSLNVFATRLFTARVEDIALPSTRVVDRRMPRAPGWSAGATFSYDAPVSFGSFRFTTNWKYDGAQFFSTFNAPIDREPSHVVGNVRVSFDSSSGAWEAAAFVNNVTDERQGIYGIDLASLMGLDKMVNAPPRWYGVQMTYRFGSGR